MTALMRASYWGHVEVMRVLIDDGGADVNAVDMYRLTSLHSAALYGHVAAAELLIARGAAVNAVNEDGWTPLVLARQNERADVERVLLAAGAVA